MSMSRRDFMKFVGISVSSMILTSCGPMVSCYTPAVMTPTNGYTKSKDPKTRLHGYWLSFGELASKTQEANNQGSIEDTYGQELIAGHRAALDELASTGVLTRTVADLIQEAYEAAVYHVWRSNVAVTCYPPAPRFDFTPASADILVQQSQTLDQIAQQGNVDPQTLENARLALQHDMAFYSLTSAQVDALYQHLMYEWPGEAQGAPDFSQVELEVSPDAKTATEFIINLLLRK